MLRATVIIVYMLFLMLGMQHEQLWTWLFILPTFVLLYMWAEDTENPNP